MNNDEYLGRVRELIPRFRERATLTERMRRLPDESWNDFQRAELLRALQPARWGGFEIHPSVFYRAVAEVSAACPSTGWVLGVLGVHSWQLAAFPERAQQDIWGMDSTVQASSSYAPTGRIERVEGGFRVSGRWSFSSGCDFCKWVILGGSTRNPDGTPDARSYLLPRSDYEIDDNWHVIGLMGSGSKDIVVKEAFVPEHRTHKFLDACRLDNPGQLSNAAPLYRLAWASVFAYAIAAPPIGAALGALECWRESARVRRMAYDRKMVAEDPFAQMRLAEAASLVESARAHAQHLRGNDAYGVGRPPDSGREAGSAALGCGGGGATERARDRLDVRVKRRACDFSRQPDAALLSRRARYPGACAQQPGACRTHLCARRTGQFYQ